MAETTTGIVGSQTKRRSDATSERNASKGVLKKIAPYVIVFLMIVIPLLFWWRSDGETAVTSMTAPTQPGKVGEATRTVHGNSYKTSITVPRDEMGVVKTSQWSEWLEIPAGCGTAFAHGNGKLFEMEGKLYGGQPFTVPPGDSFPPASHVRSRILPAGEATFGGQNGKVPITIKC